MLDGSSTSTDSRYVKSNSEGHAHGKAQLAPTFCYSASVAREQEDMRTMASSNQATFEEKVAEGDLQTGNADQGGEDMAPDPKMEAS